jgi:hypothetical protein
MISALMPVLSDRKNTGTTCSSPRVAAMPGQ